jgi:LmbE family N-acetylglucosaminyl deacetylase
MNQRRVVLHVAPHPDDELLGAGSTLVQLVRAGHRVVNLAVSLGRPDERATRRREAETVAARLGLELLVPAAPLTISSRDTHPSPPAAARDLVAATVEALRPDVVISPSPHDGHPAHELVGGAVRDALERIDDAPTWWMWSLWSDLGIATLYAPIPADVLDAVTGTLREYESQVARNDYPRLLEARASAAAVLGVERVFGFGASLDRSATHADVLCEVTPDGGRWLLGAARTLDPAAPLDATPRDLDVSAWLHQPSVQATLRAAR